MKNIDYGENRVKREKIRQEIASAKLVLELIWHNLVIFGNVTWYDFEVVLDFGLSSSYTFSKTDSQTKSRKTLPRIEAPQCLKINRAQIR